MSFWSIVLLSLIGAPMGAMFAMMMAIFGGAALANANRGARGYVIVAVGVGLSWALAAAFGAFGLVPAWRAWHGGGEHFDGGLASFGHWLVGIAFIVGLWLGQWTLQLRVRSDMAAGRKATRGLWWTVTSVNMLCLGAFVGWLAWPLVLWPSRGRFEWPDAMTGWTHTVGVATGMLGLILLEMGVRRALRR